ncbi:hypothetical protein [Olivibacter sitiensis]|uniref:hypothetical protein n=1 Tax=Olivibacter sitiensis TaxID=376470 RepID=UPI000407660D|nr:hypothetical protein [Olivibacter sitiensis]
MLDLVPLIACFIASLVFLKSDQERHWSILRLFLAFTVLTELFALYIGHWLRHSNLYVYNTYMLVEGLAMPTLLYFMNPIRKRSWLPYGSLLALWLLGYSLFYAWYIWKKGLSDPADPLIDKLCFFILFYAVAYYVGLLLSNYRPDLLRQAHFWWVNGVLFFYFGNTVLNVLSKYLNMEMWPGMSARHFLFILLNILLYGLWTLSFYLRYRQCRRAIS